MNITILDDSLDFIRSLDCFKKIASHNVKVWNDHTENIDVLAERLQDIEILVPVRERTPIGAPLLERLYKLKIISQCYRKTRIDVEACTRLGVIVSSWTAHLGPSHSTAELTLGLMIATMRQIPQQMASLKAGRWQTGVGLGLRDKTLGIFGYGQIGALVASYGNALGMKILVWGREGSLTRAKTDGHCIASNKEAFFEQSDVITLHVRLTDESRAIVRTADLARMKSTAVLINTSRAGLIEHGALETALRVGRPGMAGIDVYENEPITTDNHPLFALNNLICTPHIGYAERDSLELRFNGVFDQILAYIAGKPINVVNPQVLTGIL